MRVRYLPARTGTIDERLLTDPLDLALIGAGRVGTALGVLLTRAGHRVVAVSGREATGERAARYLPGAEVLTPEAAAARASVSLIGVPDDLVRSTCEAISGVIPEGGAVAHVSGSLGLGELASAGRFGAEPLSLHPLQTCPDVDAAVARIPGATFAVTAATDEGQALAERLVTDAGGIPVVIAGSAKPAYHAAAVFASNYLTTVQAVAERILTAVGFEDPRGALLPLVEATLENVARRGPAESLTGPAVRGDAGTVERNLEGLKQAAPEAVAAYVALARLALDLAEAHGRIGTAERSGVEEVLDRWT